ncbi:hypothetical protein [Kutzneria albida]|uniref:Uncharacterized protein n=1 Tax=Kutzneria albida DSM 43870 TaxID=1449976 RepID=W5W9B3_9PSEU|nr:hypothetical protein [Kutzneria albida]AHH97552.1 hypothetical protein KALB_4189 [Kutzneria albida DSM 43870]
MARNGTTRTHDTARSQACTDGRSIAALLAQDGIGRRSFLRWCGYIAGMLALPVEPFGARIADALTTTPRLPVLWLNGQDCNGNIEGFLRAADGGNAKLPIAGLVVSPLADSGAPH